MKCKKWGESSYHRAGGLSYHYFGGTASGLRRKEEDTVLSENRKGPSDAVLRQSCQDALSLLAKKLSEDERSLGLEFPVVTDTEGQWLTLSAAVSAGYTGTGWDHGNWHCGFLVGLHLIAYIHTGEDRYLRWANDRMRLVAQRATDANTHDIGFIFNSSAVPAYLVTSEQWLAAIALDAAKQLRQRLVTTPQGAYIAAWGPLSDPRARRSSAIDTMANLPLLYWASDFSGDASFRLAADAHSSITRDSFIRDDFSTFHAVDYDEHTGRRIRGYTFQGFSDGSAWSRGQAWAIYGYTQSARATRKVEYLDLADELVDYYLERLDQNPVPPWDFDAPGGEGVLRDSAAAAIVATALFDLAFMHPDPETAAVYRGKCAWIVHALCSDYLAHEDAHRGLLKHGCYSKPHDKGTDSATMFGDFYFSELLCKWLYSGRFRPSPEFAFQISD